MLKMTDGEREIMAELNADAVDDATVELFEREAAEHYGCDVVDLWTPDGDQS